MFATRDQENLNHIHQTAAAGKSLNQGVRTLQPKTPGNLKTPFKASRNDENKPFGFQGQKTALKDGPSKLDKNIFVTPAGPKNRAPLGAKTTNAKAQPLKTPGQGFQTNKKNGTADRISTARRSARSKITIAPSEPVHVEAAAYDIAEDEPDFGYAPPASADLPDPPMEFGYDGTFPQFRPENMFKGYGEIYLSSPKDENGISLRLKREEEEYRQFQEQRERELMHQIEKEKGQQILDPDEEVEAIIAAGSRHQLTTKVTDSNVDTLKARLAATTLSESRFKVPSVASKQTASSRAKSVTTNPSDKFAVTSRPLANRTRVLPSVSKNTIGFPTAKKAPSVIPSDQRLKNEYARRNVKNQKNIHPKEYVELYGEPPFESDMWFRWRRHERTKAESNDNTGEDDLADDFFNTDFLSIRGAGGEEDDEVFQLPMPEE